MKPEIKEILSELYELDGSLKQKEDELVSIISKMIDSKPNVAIDSVFKDELKSKILSQISNKNKIFQNLNGFKYFLTFLSWIAVLGLFLNIYPNLFNQKTDIIVPSSNDKSINLSFAPKIEKLKDNNAFWKLSFNEDDKKWWVSKWVSSSTMSAELNQVWTSVTKVDQPIDSKMSILPYPDYKPKSYVYNLKSWESLSVLPENMYVYKNKNTGIKTNSSNLSDILKTDIIDLSKLNNLWLLNLSVFEDVKDWYQFDISLSEGSVNIYRNYKKWTEVDYGNQKQLAINDVPNEDNVIKIVDDFINKYSINLDSYLKPKINNTWRKEYERIENKKDYYIPDILSVVYQFNIDWIWVYENYWTPIWLETTVNVRDMKVNSVWPIQKMDLTWSKYDLITWSWEILELAKKWPYNNVFMASTVSSDSWVSVWSSWSDWNPWIGTNAPEVEEVQVEIWNPKLVYLRKYVYNEQTKTTEQFFVPWMLFEVLTKNDDEKMIYPGEYVAVPLVKDFVDNESGGWMKVY